MQRYAVIGAGAVGGFYGARLAHAGAEVHFLLRGDFEQVSAHGLKVESKDGDFSLPAPHIHRSAETIPPCDVVLVALKAVDNPALADVLPGLVTPGTTVALFQNGLGAEDDVARWCRPRAILGGLCFICSHKPGPGHIRHLDYGRVTLAAWSADGRAAGSTPEQAALAQDLETAGLPVQCEEDLLLARWKKLMWNIPFNGLCVLLQTSTRELMDDPGARNLVRDLMEEVRDGARSMDRNVPAEFVDDMMAYTQSMVAYQPSMQLDFEAGRPMEIEAIYGRPLAAAARHGTRLPRIGMLHRALAFLEQNPSVK